MLVTYFEEKQKFKFVAAKERMPGKYPSVTIIVPAWNESTTISGTIDSLLELKYPKDKLTIFIIDDGSTDDTNKKLKKITGITKIRLSKNQGKGAAIRAGLAKATGDYVLIPDADLEYDPADINLLLQPVLSGKAEVVYGSRFLGPHKNMLFWHQLGNQFLSTLTNLFFNTTLSDMEVGYKLIPIKLLKSLNLTEKRFGFEPEVTTKILKRGIRIFEVPISYSGREFNEGKKITWRDGVQALWLVLKYRFL